MQERLVANECLGSDLEVAARRLNVVGAAQNIT